MAEEGGCPSEDEMQAEETIATLEATIERLAGEKADLLSALKEALWHLSGATEGRTRIRTDELLPAIRAAIAKAEGTAEGARCPNCRQDIPAEYDPDMCVFGRHPRKATS